MNARPTLNLTHAPLLAALAALLIGGAGCSVLKPKADLTQFHVLRAQSTGTAVSGAIASREIRVGPGGIAAYLENNRIAVEQGPNRVDYLDVYRWAEPVSKGVSRVLAENLARRVAGADLSLYPNPPLTDSGFEIRYNVERFEGTLAGPVTLEVSWQLVDRASGTAMARKRSAYTVPLQGKRTDVGAYVERLSDALRPKLQAPLAI